MSAFVDTCLFVALSNAEDKGHAKAVELFRRATNGEYGQIFSSDYVFDETVTLALMRTKNPAMVLKAGELFLGNPAREIPGLVALISVDKEAFSESWLLFKRYVNKKLSFTDCTTIALMKKENIDTLLSFDRSFDGIVKRVG